MLYLLVCFYTRDEGGGGGGLFIMAFVSRQASPFLLHIFPLLLRRLRFHPPPLSPSLPLCAQDERRRRRSIVVPPPPLRAYSGAFFTFYSIDLRGGKGGLFSGLAGGGDGERSWGILAFLFHPAVPNQASSFSQACVASKSREERGHIG